MEIKKVAIIGAGSMGGGMALALAEKGIPVSIKDPSEDTVDQLIQSAKDQGISSLLSKYADYNSLCSSLGCPKLIFFALPHGTVRDDVLSILDPYLAKGDVIIDCSNEKWLNTQRRQGKLILRGVHYIGCGISGGYQGAGRGPSMCPGGEEVALNICMPIFQKMAAKDAEGKPCVAKIGMGGSGHYVQMVHNGIAHAMMSAVSEAWSILKKHVGMSYDEIEKVFEKWSSEGELRNMFLVKIGAEVCAQKSQTGCHVLSDVQDKVAQDTNGCEGTGIWSNTEAVNLQVPAPTLSTAHSLRIASAFRGNQGHVKKKFHNSFPPEKVNFKDIKERQEFVEDLRKAVYATCLASYVQGMNTIFAADKVNKWDISYPSIVKIWKAGCVIQSGHISSLLASTLRSRSFPSENDHSLLFHPNIAAELKAGFKSLKRVVVRGTLGNAIIPTLSATLEYLKYEGNVDLPTQFYEAELGYFGKHIDDSKKLDTDPILLETGKVQPSKNLPKAVVTNWQSFFWVTEGVNEFYS